ncbi:MAG: nucleotide exchange factor GrpE [Lachnospiraceae bacterium]|nr:nucleotide exchange factor GrpE [Lachnospiraceae bacterium]
MPEEAKARTEESAASEKKPEPAETPSPEPAEKTPKKDKKGFFKGGKSEKSGKEEKAFKELETKLEEAKDRIQRQMAEFDNYRKRTEKEKAASFEIGARSVIEKLLPVVDSFERGLASLDEKDKEEPFEIGMVQVYKQLEKILEELEVKPIEARGQPFNADLHNAVMHTEDENQPENTVVEEFQKGYTFRGTVIRYSMVKVAN